jgi:hypothetical protein
VKERDGPDKSFLHRDQPQAALKRLSEANPEQLGEAALRGAQRKIQSGEIKR